MSEEEMGAMCRVRLSKTEHGEGGGVEANSGGGEGPFSTPGVADAS